MAESILLFIYFGLPFLMLGLAWAAGNWTTSRHEADMARRATAVAGVRITDLRRFHQPLPGAPAPALVVSEVTLGIDHFRGFLGKLKNIFGGEVRSYQATLDRARREAMLRLSEQTVAGGYNAIANLRVDFVDISGSASMAQKASMVSILASGTAYASADSAAA